MKLLRQFYKHKCLTPIEIDTITRSNTPGWDNEHLVTLMNDNLVARHYRKSSPDGYGGLTTDGEYYEIRLSGMAYIEQRHREFLMFAVPYAITTAIAIGALAISVMQLLLPRCG